MQSVVNNAVFQLQPVSNYSSFFETTTTKIFSPDSERKNNLTDFVGVKGKARFNHPIYWHPVTTACFY